MGDEDADAAAELDAQLARGWLADLALDEGHVCEAPRCRDG